MKKSIACGWYHSVALKDNGTIECWGNNEENKCNCVYKTFTGVISIACGTKHLVSLKSDGTIECWDLMIINVILYIKLLQM